MSISNNYIPEKINDFNTYLDGNKMIGVAASVTLPEVKMKTSTVSGAGINGEIDSPTIGQFGAWSRRSTSMCCTAAPWICFLPCPW